MTLTGTATLPIVYVLAALGGVALAFDAPGRQSLTFQMVGRRELPNAVALNSGLFNGSRVIGPAIAGCDHRDRRHGRLLRPQRVQLPRGAHGARDRARRGALPGRARPVGSGRRRHPPGGSRSCWNDPQLRSILAVVTVVSTVGFNFHVLVPLLAADTLHVGPEGFGLLSASFGLGALVGALATATFRESELAPVRDRDDGVRRVGSRARPGPERRSRGRLLFAIGIAFTLFTANANALVQLGAPDHLRGRLIGLYLFAFLGFAPVGGLFAGWLAERRRDVARVRRRRSHVSGDDRRRERAPTRALAAPQTPGSVVPSRS